MNSALSPAERRAARRDVALRLALAPADPLADRWMPSLDDVRFHAAGSEPAFKVLGDTPVLCGRWEVELPSQGTRGRARIGVLEDGSIAWGDGDGRVWQRLPALPRGVYRPFHRWGDRVAWNATGVPFRNQDRDRLWAECRRRVWSAVGDVAPALSGREEIGLPGRLSARGAVWIAEVYVRVVPVPDLDETLLLHIRAPGWTMEEAAERAVRVAPETARRKLHAVLGEWERAARIEARHAVQCVEIQAALAGRLAAASARYASAGGVL